MATYKHIERHGTQEDCVFLAAFVINGTVDVGTAMLMDASDAPGMVRDPMVETAVLQGLGQSQEIGFIFGEFASSVLPNKGNHVPTEEDNQLVSCCEGLVRSSGDGERVGEEATRVMEKPIDIGASAEGHCSWGMHKSYLHRYRFPQRASFLLDARLLFFAEHVCFEVKRWR